MVYQDATGLYHFLINVIPFISISVACNNACFLTIHQHEFTIRSSVVKHVYLLVIVFIIRVVRVCNLRICIYNIRLYLV